MQNQASIECFHNSKLIIILCSVVIFCIVAVITFKNSTTESYSSKIYDTPKSVENLFVDNQDSFKSIAGILNDSELFDYLYSIDRKSIFSPKIPKKEEYLTEEEYKQICAFLNEYQPYEIGQTEGNLHFVFLCKNYDVTLYYTQQEGEKLSDFLRYVGQDYEIKAMNKCWYIRVSPCEPIRQ